LLQEEGRGAATAPTAPSRKLIHTRHVVCNGYERSDGLYDIEARMQDISPDGTDLLFKRLEAGERIHDMRLVVTIDSAMVIRHVQAHTDAGPSTYCSEAPVFYAALEGLTIGRGFKQKVNEIVGGAKGCTHLTELLGPLATTAMQTLFAVRRRAGMFRRALEGDGPVPKPFVIDTCHAYRSDGEGIKVLWPEHRRG
jgi:hypothetical protein